MMKRETIIWAVILVIAGTWLAWRGLSTGCGSVYVQTVDGQQRIANAWQGAAGTAQFDVSRTVGVWLGAVMTLCILSFAYKDNPFYKTAEALLVGVSAAYWMVVSFWTTIIPNLFGNLIPAWISSWAMPGLSPNRDDYWWLYLVPLVLGAMLLWRLSPRGNWIARWPLAFIIGATAGMRLVGFIQADLISQTNNSIIPLVAMKVTEAGDHTLDIGMTLGNITLVIGVLCCLVYFFFSVEHKGWVGRVSRVGTWFLMITFGAAFGYTVMGRIALLAIRLEFLFNDWLWLIDPGGLRPPGWG